MKLGKARKSSKSSEVVKYVQGDVILTLVKELPDNMVEFNSKTKVLQESEVTGHHHHFKPNTDVVLYVPRDISKLESLSFTTITPDEGKYIQVKEPATLYHGKDFEFNPSAKGIGDHNALSLPSGIYKVDIVREYDYDYMETKRVVD